MVQVTTLGKLTILGEPNGVLVFVFHITVPEKIFKSQRKFSGNDTVSLINQHVVEHERIVRGKNDELANPAR